MKMTVFWVVASYSPLEFTDVSVVLADSTIREMEASSTSETSVYFYDTALYNNPEDSHLHTYLPPGKPDILFSAGSR
jgi:hypothetical protein